jgi:hypothetical protein
MRNLPSRGLNGDDGAVITRAAVERKTSVIALLADAPAAG